MTRSPEPTKTYCQLVQEACAASAESPHVLAGFQSIFLNAERVIATLRTALSEYACPGRGACPVPWDSRGCSLGDDCGLIAADALNYEPPTPLVSVESKRMTDNLTHDLDRLELRKIAAERVERDIANMRSAIARHTETDKEASTVKRVDNED